MLRFSLTESGLLLDNETCTAFSPAKGAWVKASISGATFLDSGTITDEEAAALIRDSSSLREPPV